MAKRTYKKHFVIFNNGGVISATTPKDWARSHREFFKNKDFSDDKNAPTVDVIEKVLVKKLNFNKITNNEVVICYDYISL
jgi:hypothetical protein